ncbi:MAG: hypothetical protein NTY30_04580 [Candidatus Berkelbacteria bacterium]|nr:hypothetical protein [Candidatus Berkelbacteria bacterium]
MSDRASFDLQRTAKLMSLLKVSDDDVQATIDDRRRRLAVEAALKGTLQLPVRSRKSRIIDPLAEFRSAKLQLIADKEIGKAFTTVDGADKSGYGKNWLTKKLPPMKIDGKEITADWLTEYRQFCQSDSDWQCTPIPTYHIDRIAAIGVPVTIEVMSNCWSWEHDGIKPPVGVQIRRLQYSNWMLDADYRAIAELAISAGQWKMNYWPSPAFTANLNWSDQKLVISSLGLCTVSAADSLWFTNILVANKVAKPNSIWSRVDTVLGGYPLSVELWRDGVSLARSWRPVDRYPSVRAAVSGVNWNFGT